MEVIKSFYEINKDAYGLHKYASPCKRTITSLAFDMCDSTSVVITSVTLLYYKTLEFWI